MSDMRQNLLINTKLVLRYLVNRKRESYQTVDTINIDFYNYTRRYIPFFELGYYSLMTFLQNIPDILKVDFFTEEVEASDVKSFDQISPAPYFSNVNVTLPVPTFQCCHSTPPLYQTRDLPWTTRMTYAMNSRESNNRIYRPIPIQHPNKLDASDSKKIPPSSPGLGPRTYGDGKFSSSDSLSNKQDSEMTAFENSSTFSNDFIDQYKASTSKDCLEYDTISRVYEKNYNEQSGVRSSNSSESEEEEIFKWKENIETEKIGNFTITEHFDQNNETGHTIPNDSLSSTSLSRVGTPPPPYLDQDVAASNDVWSDPEKLSKPSYYYDSTSSDEKILETTMEEDAIPFMVSDDEEKIQMLDSNFTNEKYGAKFTSTAIEDVIKQGRFYEIYISEVNNPYKFWFQMADENPNPVDDMQEELNFYYNQNSSSYTAEDYIKKAHLAKGYACAALYGKRWHRAELLQRPVGNTVKVFFVDFGTVDEVSINDVRYLLNSFCCVPKLCHRGTLDFVKPRNSHRWNIESTSFFKGLIDNTKLVVGVSEIDRNTNSARLYLMDRNKNINVNHKMVYDGHAFPQDPRTRYQRLFAEAVPSFDSLEKGVFPSVDEVAVSLERGHDIEKEFESSIIEEIDCFIQQYTSDEEAFQRVENFKKEREKAKELAAQRDASTFLDFFGSILKNPFLNGDWTNNFEETSINPFLDI